MYLGRPLSFACLAMRRILLACLFGIAPLAAQPADSLGQVDLPARLVAAVHPAPPYAIKNDDGTWDGAAVELWRELGRVQGFEAALREVPREGLVEAVVRGEVDLALTATASAEDEARVDFTTPYHTATLGVAEKRGSGIKRVLKNLFTPTFGKIVLVLSLLLLLVGVIVWLFERRDNEDDFREGKEGVWDGFWWAGVTMTTIGYGDKSPDSVGGKITALLWMLVSMAVTAALTAAVVASLGLKSSSSASLPGDVRGEAVGVLEDADAARYLQAERVRTQSYPSVLAGLKAVEHDSLDAFVGAAPVLQHVLSESGIGGLTVNTTSAEPQRWALAVPTGSPLREALGRAVLGHTRTPSWQATLERYSIGG